MLDANPNLTPAQVLDILKQTALDWGPAGQDVDFGYGRLDSYAAVKKAGGYSGTGPAVPQHRYFEGSLGGSGQQAEHSLQINSTDYPLSVTMIMRDWTGRSSPDFDLYIYGPDGAEVGKSTGTSRQETVARRISKTGTYKIVVKSYSGSGAYFVDVSGAADGQSEDQAPTVSIDQPSEGATVSGTVTVKVRATDDQQVSKVEVSIDSGSWSDVTGSFDGTHYLYQWETGAVSNGAHTINARATDSAGQTAQDVRNVTVDNGGTPTLVYEKRMTGRVSSSAKNQTHDVTVHAAGWVDLSLGWQASADLDFYVYAPDGSYVGRAYTLKNPETLQVDTERWGTGTYKVRVNHYSGADADYTLTATGVQADTYTGSVSASSRDYIQDRYVSYQGAGKVHLSWPSSADLDFYVYDPDGTQRTRAYTLNNPEVARVTFDEVGYWRVRVNLYSGSSTSFTLKMYVPDAILS